MQIKATLYLKTKIQIIKTKVWSALGNEQTLDLVLNCRNDHILQRINSSISPENCVEESYYKQINFF